MKTLFIPENLNLKSILTEKRLHKPIHLDRFFYIISLIYEHKVLYKDKREFIPLKYIYLREIMIDPKYYVDILVKNKIISCDYKAIQGIKAYGYKILNPYMTSRFIEVSFHYNRHKNKVKEREQNKIKINTNKEVNNHLYSFLTKIELDYEESYNRIKYLDKNKFNIIKVSIDKIKNKEFYLIEDEYGRIHTNITNTKEYVRNELTYKQNRLISIDIVNSQPLFLLNLIKIKTSQPLNLTDFETEDFKLYEKLVQEGRLYDYLLENSKTRENRSKFKERLFRETFYGRRISKEFWSLFPTVSKFLLQLKQGNYRKAAWSLQRAESKMMIDTICVRLMKEYPKIFITTVHDSIMTIEPHVDLIKGIIIEEFGKLNLKPTLRTK